MFVEDLKLNAFNKMIGPALPTERIYVLYLLSALVLAVLTYMLARDDHEVYGPKNKRSLMWFFKYVFSSDIYRGETFKQDVIYFFVNAVLFYGVIFQFLFTVHEFSNFAHTSIVSMFGTNTQPVVTSFTHLAIFTAISVVIMDICVFAIHYLQHRVPVLWNFHQVHHSAAELTPMTLFRLHPVDLILMSLTISLVTGFAIGTLFYFTGEEPQQVSILGLNILVFLFYIGGYNLRHSHIWLSYPQWLSKILISPAQHQIHHSRDPKHFDKNMGLIFAFWDGILNTLYVPKGFENLRYGINDALPNPFRSVTQMYMLPFVWSWRQIKPAVNNLPRAGIIVTSIAVIGLGYSWFYNNYKNTRPGFHLESVALLKMNWFEVKAALDNGYDTIIIPTAGTEQNGPFVPLGKHHVVVNKTSHMIAHQLGHALIAPVIDYVPEGEISPKPTIHMAWPGTISIPEPVFEAMLTATAQSMKQHGFKHIYFLGDSGGNQQAQNKVAAQLSAIWRADGIEVANISDYYSANGQFDHLLQQGYSKQDIGGHAGIRDTSEMLFIAPELVKFRGWQLPKGEDAGFDGNAGKASAKIGQQMVQLKVNAALAQMKSLRKKFEQQLLAGK